MSVYLRAKFEVSNVILTGFRQGGNFTHPTSKRTPKKPSQIRVNVDIVLTQIYNWRRVVGDTIYAYKMYADLHQYKCYIIMVSLVSECT